MCVSILHTAVQPKIINKCIVTVLTSPILFSVSTVHLRRLFFHHHQFWLLFGWVWKLMRKRQLLQILGPEQQVIVTH